ncbi:hypothetical protein LX64_01100 [Chitinophaga skermanii]|uniref:Uncharacterized protein n=1 Tax=Chitinophaga skermanii TaxID=331697 RepID=A0A327QV10_9BACT|nr:hypothetical protein [Chitinophaga skermanii]RAJ08449.1 hypothetical protein LX64_01100 [Chitinophaga skermanii]
MNILAYAIYLTITFYITTRVGRVLFKNGYVFVLPLLENDEKLTLFVNKMLLTGYYLVNLGYATAIIITWHNITTWTYLVQSIVEMIGRILLILAGLHWMNMIVIHNYGKQILSSHHKT